MECDTHKHVSVPVSRLLRIIRKNDQLVKDFIEKYFNQALSSFLDYQRHVEEQIRQSHGLPSALPLVTAWTKAVLEPFSSAISGRIRPAPAQQPDPVPTDQVEQLRQKVRDLQAQVTRLGRKPKSRLKRAARRSPRR